MRNIIEELYYGNITPCDRDIVKGGTYSHLLHLVTSNEDDLMQTLTQAQQGTFEKFKDCASELNDTNEVTSFTLGFKLGMRLALEAMISTSDTTYDDVIRLFFSLDKEYRRNAVWIMNDETALKLRTIKDASGNYLWNHTDNTIMGKPVYISNYMPSEAAGAKPIAFGDFSYYWIIDRMPFTMRRLNELFIAKGQVGYLGYEYLDAKLIRPNAVHVMQITD